MKLITLLALFGPLMAYSQTNRFVSSSGSDSGNCSSYGSPCLTINYAIGQSIEGDDIYVSSGSFASATLDKRVSIKGRGSSTIIAGMTIDAAISGAELVSISDVDVSGGAVGILISTSFVRLENVNASGHSSRNISLDNSGSTLTDIILESCQFNDGGSTGLFISNGTTVDGLTALNSTFDNNTFGLYFSYGNNSVLSTANNIIFRNCTFSSNLRKGIYAEKLENALFENISVVSSGTDVTYDFNNGVDINLKWQAYSDITIRNSRILNSGAIGINDIGTAPENRRTSALTIKARTDASSYNGSPASLTNVILDGLVIDGQVTDLRFGEMGKTDNNGIDMSTVSISHCYLVNDNLAGLLNEENTNTLTISNNYWGGGAPTGTDIEDYGTSAVTSQSSELANLIVDESNNTYASFSAALSGVAVDGTIQHVPTGALAGSTVISQNVTLSTPGAGLLDATNSLTTFENLTVSGGALTLASDFAASSLVTLSSDVVLGDYNFDGAAVSVNSTASIQDGVQMITSGGTVTVASGTYAETIVIEDALTLDGSAGAIIEPGSLGTAVDILADGVTIDGFQIGTDGTTSNAVIGINSFWNDGLSLQNNTIFANTVGISINISETGNLLIDNNNIQMLALEDVVSATGSIGLNLQYIVGDVDADITDNDFSNAVTGIFAFGLTSSTELIIDGGNYNGCTTGILPINFNGTSFSPSTLTVRNLIMSGFATDPDVSDTETGVYAISVGGTSSDDITIVIDNLEVSGVNNDLSNYAGLVVADFPTASDGAGVDATIINCNIHDNANRGIYLRGEDAEANISQSLITGNGFDPTATGGNPGFSVIAREGSNATVSNCVIINPATLSAAEDIPGNYYLSGLHMSTGGSLVVSDCSLDQNGNGFIAQTSGIDLSGNYFGTTDEATILSLVGAANDFTPWFEYGVDTDLGTTGFQPNRAIVHVGSSGTQTSGDRIQEGHDLIVSRDTVIVETGTYAEILLATKNIVLQPAATVTLDNIGINAVADTLTIDGNMEINTAISLTDGILNAAGLMILGSAISDLSPESTTAHVIGNVSSGARNVGMNGLTSILGIELSTGVTDIGDVTIIRSSGGGATVGTLPDGPPDNRSIDMRWDITSTTPPTSRDVTYRWMDFFDNGNDLTNLVVYRSTGGGIWDEYSGTVHNLTSPGPLTNPRVLTESGVTGFSVWTIAEDAEVLPVELISFSATPNNGRVMLTWETASELNNDRFEVECSKDGESFNQIGTVGGKGTTSSRNSYSFVDQEPMSGINYYRLKQVDFDGASEYSKVIWINPYESSEVQVYPNPAQNVLKIVGNGLFTEKNKVRILNIEGKEMDIFTPPMSTQELRIDLKQYPVGIYIIEIATPDRVYLHKFIKD